MNRQSGFTLIELVIILVLLGILGAVAVPKYLDLSVEAETAALTSIASSIESSSAINLAAIKAGQKATTIAVGDSCTTKINALMTGNALPSGYSVDTTFNSGNVSAGASADYGQCQIEYNQSGRTQLVNLLLAS